MQNFILLQASGGGFDPSQIIMLVAMGLIFYVFFIRPQQKKSKDQKKYIEEIAKGTQVVTVGGIHGKVLSVDDTTIVIEVDKGCKLTVEKSSISLDGSKKVDEKK